MAGPCGTEALGPIVNRLLDCLASAMEDCSRPPCRIFLATTENVPWDECCDCGDGEGQAWVSVSEIRPQTVNSKCNAPYEASVQMGILRCALTMSDNGEAPDADALTAETLRILQDRMMMTRAVFFCFSDTIERDDWDLLNWNPLGPRGGCAGGVLELNIRFNDRC